MISQIQLIAAISDGLSKQGVKTLNTRQANAIIRAANDIILEIDKPTIAAAPGSGLNAWLESDDAGSSSLYMAYMLAYGPFAEPAYPLDADDFGRCYRFLRAVPEAKSIALMVGCGIVWSRLVREWDLLEQLYVSGNRAGVDAAIQEIIRRAV